MNTTPIFIPLTEGLDLSKDRTLGGHQLTMAENVDFSVAGEVRGRPGRGNGAPKQFIVRDPANSYYRPQYLAASTFANTGFTPSGMLSVRDITGERPFLATRGRLFGLENNTEWKDRGSFECAKVDKLHTFWNFNQAGLTATAPPKKFLGPDFGAFYQVTNDDQVALLNPTTLGFERGALVNSTGSGLAGGMARCGTTTAAVFKVGGGGLYLVTRANGASTTTSTLIASDPAVWVNDGDAAAICCDSDQTVFYVTYQTTVADQYKVLRVTTAGSVTHTYTGSLAGIHGQWASNSTVAVNRVAVGVTNATGLTVKILSADTLTDQTLDSTYVTADTAKEVVVGFESSTRMWWAYRSLSATVNGLHIGMCNPSTGSTATLALSYLHDTVATRQYTPVHQPLYIGGRMYLTVGSVDEGSNTLFSGTWVTLDLSNVKVGTTNGPFQSPGMFARGGIDTYCPGGVGNSGDGSQRWQPWAATVLSDSSGWVFPSYEWTSFAGSIQGTSYNPLALAGTPVPSNVSYGYTGALALNRVSFSKPRCVQAGKSTIFSGSIPHLLAGDRCYEHGFVLDEPSIAVRQTAAGALADGSYTVYVVWAVVDDNGDVHRSAPSSVTKSVAAGGGTGSLTVHCVNPYFTERDNQHIFAEVYCTTVDSAADAAAAFQTTITPSTSSGSSSAAITVVTSTGNNLYALADEFQHITPSADGGIAALGRRVWMASGTTVYASLLLNPGEGTTWNDEGSLSVDLPAGNGRIVALEGLDDKLVVFCERGVFFIQDGGPNNVGDGPDIAFPIKLSDLGVAGPRSTCVTDRGVVFCTSGDKTNTDRQRSGPWLLDRALTLTERQYLGTPALDYLNLDSTFVPEVAFSPERQQVYMMLQSADADSNSGVLVIDTRMQKWSTWSVYEVSLGEQRSIAVVNGCLWDLCTEPEGYTNKPGYGYFDAVSMRVRTTHLSSNGQDGLGRGRVRSVSALGPQTQDFNASQSYDLVMYATLDHTRTYNSSNIVVPLPVSAAAGTWPSATRTDPEWRLPVQKCASIQVKLEANMYARWSAIRLDVLPQPGRTPARQRV